MNTPNKLTILRIVLSIAIVIILILPFDALGISLPKLFVNELIVVDIKYIIAGGIFVIAALTDMLDGYIARKKHLVSDVGKMLDAIADKVLVNPCLVLLASMGFIHPIIPTIIIMRDIIVDALKMYSGNKGKVIAASPLGKIKTVCLMSGIVLTLFYNLPFELINIKIAEILLIFATVLSVASAAQYYNNIKLSFTEKKEFIEFDDKSV